MDQKGSPRRSSFHSNSNRGGSSRYGSNRKPSNNRRTPSSSSRHKQHTPRVSVKSLTAELNKFLSKANDAKSSGDLVNSEHFFQHADHYFRMIEIENIAQQEKEEKEKENKARIEAKAAKIAAEKAEAEKLIEKESESKNDSNQSNDIEIEPSDSTPDEPTKKVEEDSDIAKKVDKIVAEAVTSNIIEKDSDSETNPNA